MEQKTNGIIEKAEYAFCIKTPHKDSNKDELINVRTKTIKEFTKVGKIAICEYNHYEIDYIASKLSTYFKRYTKLIKNEKNKKYSFLLRNQLITTKTQLFFGYSLSELAGRNIAEKYHNLTDRKYLIKLLNERKQFHIESFSLHKNKGEYVSDNCLKYQEYKEKQTNSYLDKKKLVMPDGNEISLLEMKKNSSQSKVAEIYNVCRLMTEIANNENKKWMMVTITAPGIFHINPTKSKNDNWDIHNTAKDCDHFISAIYRNATKTLNRKIKSGEIGEYYGVWCKEPHKSGALHQHILLYVDNRDIDEIQAIFETSSNNAFNKINQKWIKNKSVNFVLEDKEKGGSGSSYVFKYIMKSLGVDEYTTNDGNKIEIEQSKRVNSHMRTFKYKRYSFIGINKNLSIWRDTRGVIRRSGYENNKSVYPVKIQEIFDSVINNDYFNFCKKVKYKNQIIENGFDKYGNIIYKKIGISYFAENQEYYFGLPEYIIK